MIRLAKIFKNLCSIIKITFMVFDYMSSLRKKIEKNQNGIQKENKITCQPYYTETILLIFWHIQFRCLSHLYNFLNKIEILPFSIWLLSENIDIIKSSSLYRYIFFETFIWIATWEPSAIVVSPFFCSTFGKHTFPSSGKGKPLSTLKASPGRTSKCLSMQRRDIAMKHWREPWRCTWVVVIV